MAADSAIQTATGKDGPILIVLQLAGGNDGMNTVIPYADDAYYRARPVIGIPKDTVIKLNDYIGLNPKLAGLKGLYDEGHLSILQGVGYPEPQPLPLPLDGNLADRLRRRQNRALRLAGALLRQLLQGGGSDGRRRHRQPDPAILRLRPSRPASHSRARINTAGSTATSSGASAADLPGNQRARTHRYARSG